jgi:putative SOS response-associated peptidase YedK
VARWGFLTKEGRPLINARGETVATKFPFKFSFGKRRCIVPMSGYYEWKTEGGAKQPYFVHRADDAPLAAAGVYDRAKNPKTGEPVDTVAIITTAAGDDLRALHDRMPVFIPPERHALWLSAETPAEVAGQLLLPLPGLVVSPASRRVNSVKNNGPDLLDPLAG